MRREALLDGLGDTARDKGDQERARTFLTRAADLYDALGLTGQAAAVRRRIPPT
ncbi:hypothetical protein [Frankia sp. Cppng1_Ct_nod]|uniref:hypothetical protein n=1 Tax=Frankia sp. Cppng1_Ct_nod TaxID=2897162 RepID=UPI0013EF8B6C|nr:hypothetical protein [Frankia sp. Cppng1_Ct_nod]